MSWITSLSTEKPYEERLETENASLRAEVERLKGDFNIETLKQIVVVLGCEANEFRQRLAKAVADRDCWYEQSELLQHQNDEAFAELRGHINEQEQQLAASQRESKRLREALLLIKYETDIHGNSLNTPTRSKAVKALSSPTSTDALDAYVAEIQAFGNTAKHLLSELLAVLHGDGGHHEDKVGTVQAVEDAMQVFYKRIQQRDLAVSALKTCLPVYKSGLKYYYPDDQKIHEALAAIKESEANPPKNTLNDHDMRVA